MYQVSLLACMLVFHPALAQTVESISDPARPFQLTVSPALVNRYTSESMSLRCARTPGVETRMAHIFRMRIIKQTGSGWSVVAEQRDVDARPAVYGDMAAAGDLTGDVADAFLEMSWEQVADDNFGVYKCDIMGFDAQHNFIIERTAADDVQESDAPDEYLVKLSQETQEKVSDLKKATEVEIPLLKKQFLALKETCSRLESSLIQNKWPAGYYALAQPRTGCPYDLKFYSGTYQYQKIYTERYNTNDDASSAFSDLTVYTGGTKRFVALEFCEAKQQMNTISWPQGSFCVYKINYQPCPPNFNEGSVLLSSETWKAYSGQGRNNVADGPFNPTIGFCCQSTVNPDVPIQLPTNSPFLLFRYGGECQAVEGMTVSEEFIQVDTEDNGNVDKFEGQYPDIDKGNTLPKFHLCYYTKA